MEKTLKPTKIFDVYFGEKKRSVYNIPGKEHSGHNDTIKTYWIYWGQDMTEEFEGLLLPSADSPEFLPYCEKSIKRRCWDIRVKEYNTTKEKHGDTDFRSGCHVEMWCNGALVYSFGTTDALWAMSKAAYLKVVLSEHSYDFFDPKSNEGRKIYYYGLPATVKIMSDTWEINVVPDISHMTEKEWWAEYIRRQAPCDTEWADIEDENIEENIRCGYINHGSALSDGNINWFRKDDDVKIDVPQ